LCWIKWLAPKAPHFGPEFVLDTSSKVHSAALTVGASRKHQASKKGDSVQRKFEIRNCRIQPAVAVFILE
jgi:hypothetical protein